MKRFFIVYHKTRRDAHKQVDPIGKTATEQHMSKLTPQQLYTPDKQNRGISRDL